MGGTNGSGISGKRCAEGIDEIDESMVALFAERMDIAEDVAETSAHQAVRCSTTREISARSPIWRPSASARMSPRCTASSLALSRMRQHVVLDESQGERLADNAVKREGASFLGGAYGHSRRGGIVVACSHRGAMLDDVHPEFLSGWEDVCAAVGGAVRISACFRSRIRPQVR